MQPEAVTAREQADSRRWWTLSVLCLSLLMVVVGNTTLNVTLPTLVRDLGATTTQLQWIVDAYGLVFAGLLLTSGALGDRFGRKGALTIGLVIFGAGSALAGVSSSANQIIATRALMGAGASLVMPATLSILTTVFPVHERARAIAIWAGVAGAGGAIGPIASGVLLAHFSWGSVFFINLPVVATALIGGRFLVPTSRDPRRVPLDLVGAGLSIVGMATLLYGIIEAPIRGWANIWTLACFALAVVVFVSFAVWELRNPHPMLDLRFFKRPAFTGGATSITLVFFAMFGMFFLLTQYLQVVHGYSALGAGLRMLPMACTLMVVAPLSARVAERIGTKQTVTTGLLIAATGMVVLSRLGVHSSYAFIAGGLLILATGMALTMPPSTAAIMSSLPMRKAGVGSAMNDTTRELGGALGVAVLGSILASHYSSSLAGAVHALPGPARAAALASVGGAVDVAQHLGAGGAALAASARSAFVGGMSLALLVAAGVALSAAALVHRILPVRLSYDHEEPVVEAADEAERLAELAPDALV